MKTHTFKKKAQALILLFAAFALVLAGCNSSGGKMQAMRKLRRKPFTFFSLK